jgi:hypothetical protein
VHLHTERKSRPCMCSAGGVRRAPTWSEKRGQEVEHREEEESSVMDAGGLGCLCVLRAGMVLRVWLSCKLISRDFTEMSRSGLDTHGYRDRAYIFGSELGVSSKTMDERRCPEALLHSRNKSYRRHLLEYLEPYVPNPLHPHLSHQNRNRQRDIHTRHSRQRHIQRRHHRNRDRDIRHAGNQRRVLS